MERTEKTAKNSRKPLARMTYQYTLNQPRDFQTFHGQYCSKYHAASSANHKKSLLGLVAGMAPFINKNEGLNGGRYQNQNKTQLLNCTRYVTELLRKEIEHHIGKTAS